MDKVYIKVEELNKCVAKYFEGKDIITIDNLIAIIEELDSELKYQEERYEELENNLHNNYEPISPYRLYGINERDFH